MCTIYLLLDVKQYTAKQSIKQTAIDNYNDKYVTFVFIEWKKNPFIFVSLVLSYIILLVNDVISCIYKPLAIVIFYDEMNVRVY